MGAKELYLSLLHQIKGKTVALIYIFEGEDAPGFDHYWIWKSDIISGWLTAIQELECIPYIMDVRTFIQKAVYNSLPRIDYVLNLNCGNYKLSSLSLVPSMCSFLDIPCIPCDASTIIMSENKNISNLLAQANGLNIPPILPNTSTNGIFRPLNLGSSIGIELGKINQDIKEGLYQEFIPGYDVTFPLLCHPVTRKMEMLSPIIYLPKTENPNWFYNTEEKYCENEGFTRLPLLNISASVKRTLLTYVSTFPIYTFGRLDARICCRENKLSKDIARQPLTLDNLYFIEINSMPTIERNDSFELAFNMAANDSKHNLYNVINDYNRSKLHPTMIGFILSAAMLMNIKPTSQSQTDLIHIEE